MIEQIKPLQKISDGSTRSFLENAIFHYSEQISEKETKFIKELITSDNADNLIIAATVLLTIINKKDDMYDL